MVRVPFTFVRIPVKLLQQAWHRVILENYTEATVKVEYDHLSSPCQLQKANLGLFKHAFHA